ncbi:peptidoglycan-binding protein [Guptibacillus hwajinpoensis]|uniref:C40 family peptidase n=1 Tax=Guptibacillus hwajinpoensis TaxID=208199 RepID=UPI00272DEE0C|nr:peptidoglycan-binding protein [Pseudalkalibacillus hwajinpoensis]
MQLSTWKKTLVGSAFLTGLFYVQTEDVEASLGDQALQKGMNSPDVKELQDVLKEKGYFTYHTSTGYFGPITEQAVKDFQKATGLKITGTVSGDTLNALKGSVAKSAPATSSSTLTIGDRGQSVTSIQSTLKSKGYYNYNVDGIFGPITEKAVKQFQSANGLSASGVVDQATENALNAAEAKQEADGVLKTGSRGSEVTSVQQQLKNKGYYNYNVDGIYGPITEKAVKKFQSANGLSQTGVVDSQTKTKLSSSSVEEKKEEVSGLKVGARGSSVTSLQQNLKDRGYYNYNVDGIFGSITEKAVKEFQSIVGLPVTGVANDATIDALKARGGTTQTPVSDQVTQGDILKLGVKGEGVKELQSKLTALGYYKGSKDGDFGPATEQAVKNFQSRNKLTVDGVVGPATWEKLKQGTAYSGSESDNTGSGSQSFNAMDLIADASEFIGVPYTWGGNTPQSGFDCSGFLVYVFKKQGISLPRTMAQMWNVTDSVSSPSVGDIVYFTTYKPGASHGGIYIGNNKFIHAGSSTGVTISDMTSSYWAPRYLGAKRAH